MSALTGEGGKVGVVVIGRNEGQRLISSLDSVAGKADYIVYVDSASNDGSADRARNAGVDVIELDDGRPCTAARARNAGFARVEAVSGGIDYVQFVDGDCILDTAWLGIATAFMESRRDVAVVCGRLRERFPDKTVYNLLCEMEWSLPCGETGACGGNAFVRADAFRQSGGFRENLIAGEEPELCLRLRRGGWKIWRLPEEMVLHDADMSRFSQWWTRSVRAGFTFAEGARELGRDCAPQRNRALLWGLFIPATVAAGTLLFGPLALWLAMVYPLQVARLALRSAWGARNNLIYAFFEVLGRFAEMTGVLKFYARVVLGRHARIIEYK